MKIEANNLSPLMMEVAGFLADVTEDVFDTESDSATGDQVCHLEHNELSLVHYQTTGDQVCHLEPTEERKANGNPNIRSVGYIKALKRFTSDYFILLQGRTD